VKESGMTQSPQIGERMSAKTAPPDDSAVREWIGPEASQQWTELRAWIDANYPGVFEPEWLYGGQKRGWSLRYKKTRAFCTLLPEYQRLSVIVVLGRAERDKFEERRYIWRDKLIKLYDEAKVFPDGMFLAVPVATADDRKELIELLIMKRPPPS
jgi:hypothetical protein